MKAAARSGTTKGTLVGRRLTAQQLGRMAFSAPGEVVAWLGAVQAQDYPAAKWAVGLRLAGAATDASIERSLAEGAVLRTHALRGTWQMVAPADIRWILALVAPRVVAGSATRHRQLALEEGIFRRSNAAIARALGGGDHLTRAELAAVLEGEGISTAGQRLAYLLQRAELDALICSGARRGKQLTYALLDRRAPLPHVALRRDAALAELARRYFRSRGPATVGDFAWWSGLTASDARAGLESVEATLASEAVGGRTYWHAEGVPANAVTSPRAHLLPAFDEYLLAYRDRDAALDPTRLKRLNAGGGMLGPCLVVDGRVVGTWWRVLARATVAIEIEVFQRPTRTERQAIAAAARRYAAFLGLEARIAVVMSRGGPSRTPSEPSHVGRSHPSRVR